MGRPRTPTTTLEARGAFKRNPDRGRARESEPVSDKPLGEAPDHFTDEEAKAWAELQLHAPAGVLRVADRMLVEITCRCLASLREPTMTVITKDGSAIVVDKPFDSKIAGVLLRCLVEMGLSPVSRSKVNIPKAPGPKSDFDKLM